MDLASTTTLTACCCAKAVLEELDQLEESIREEKPAAKMAVDKAAKRAFSKATSGHRGAQPKPLESACLACSEKSHAGRLFACTTFRGMDLQTKKAHLNSHGLCHQCLGIHAQRNCDKRFICTKADCRTDKPHHYLLCPRSAPLEDASRKANSKSLGLTNQQEELLAKGPR